MTPNVTPDTTLLVGHEDAKATLRRLRAHTLLFTGPERVGRRFAASWYARLLNCAAPGEEPCGRCASCRHPNHPDYRELAPEAETKSGRASRRPQIRIDALVERQGGDPDPLSRWLATRPQFRRRVAVIDGADSLNEAAANAFLKVLEEPPSYASIILIAPSPGAVLPTIASRSTVVRFGPLSATRLGAITSLHPARRLGRVGELLEAAQHEDVFTPLLDVVDAYLRTLPSGLEEALEAADGLEKVWLNSRFDVPALLRARLADGWPPSAYAAALGVVGSCQEALAAYASPTIAVQVMTLRLREIVLT